MREIPERPGPAAAAAADDAAVGVGQHGADGDAMLTDEGQLRMDSSDPIPIGALRREASGLAGSLDLALPPSWEAGAAEQLQALVADVEAAVAGTGGGGGGPDGEGDADALAIALAGVGRGGGGGGAQQRRAMNLRSFSFPGGSLADAAGPGGEEEGGGGGGGAPEGDREPPRMVPLEAVGEARLSSPRARGWPAHGAPAAAAAAAAGRPPVASTSPAAASRPGGGASPAAAAAAAVAAMVESMGREQRLRAEQREAAARAGGAPGLGDELLADAPPLPPPLPPPPLQVEAAATPAGRATMDSDDGGGGGGGAGSLPRDALAAMSVSGPAAAAMAAAAAAAAAGDNGAAGAGGMEAPPELPAELTLTLLEGGGGSGGGGGGLGDLMLGDLDGVLLSGDGGDGGGGGGGSGSGAGLADAAAAAAATQVLRGWDGVQQHHQQQQGSPRQQYEQLHRQLSSLQKQQQQQQAPGLGTHPSQLRTASGRLQGWPGPFGAPSAPSPSGGRGAGNGGGDGDTEMEAEQAGASGQPDCQQQQQQQQQSKQQRADGYDPPGAALGTPLVARQRSGGSSLLLGGASCDDGDSDATIPLCLNCTAALFGPRCGGCGHASADDVALLQGRLPPIPDAPARLPRQLASRPGPGAPGAPLLAYDPRLLQHRALRSRSHPERPERTSAVMARLAAAGLSDRCRQVPCRAATDAELAAVHDLDLISQVRRGSGALGGGGGGRGSAAGAPPASINHGHEAGLPRVLDCYLTAQTFACASLAAGSAAEVAAAVARGAAPGGAAIIRPPGHHAESGVAMGFCLFNNAAVAARAAQAAGARRVLIVDWDVHHGNGTQEIFEADPSVLYMSIHRHDGGSFFPGTGAAADAGTGAGEGFSLNVPWSGPGAGDGDYISAFTRVLLPVAYEFAPDLLIVSAGFDAAAGDPLGGCRVTPDCFGHLTALLQPVAPLVLLLEGGYNLTATALSVEACMRALLGEAPPPLPRPLAPTAVGLAGVARALAVHARYWRCLGPPLSRRGSAGVLQPMGGPAAAAASGGGGSPPLAAAGRGGSGSPGRGGGARRWLPGSPPPSPATEGMVGADDSDCSGGGDSEDGPMAMGEDADGALSPGDGGCAGAGTMRSAESGCLRMPGRLSVAAPPPLPPGPGSGPRIGGGPLLSPAFVGGGGAAAAAAERWVPPSPQLAALASPSYEPPGAGGAGAGAGPSGLPPVML
ncbi:histone deacetylase [Raphidocelis subcapitata]|uniref:Histone deacetylase n=1 Tax=Raphidocelis subcapitata TaxID=307507 RepID=A0A2V0PDT8_9CHLO|nr:histone deacetylase [Raphidocelis subcapitata]|eukprot:GBF97132.1 histone deacetylase [Raphidocelis subcapitata]